MSGFVLSSYTAFFVTLLLLGSFLVWERRRVKRRLERFEGKAQNDKTPS